MKAFGTTNHALFLEILQQYGAPLKIVSAIERMHQNLTVLVKLGKEKAEIPQTIGVRQGNNLSPALFLFFMSAFAESLETEWEENDLVKATFLRVSSVNFNNQSGQLLGHKLKMEFAH